jgi:hypothetical protein
VFQHNGGSTDLLSDDTSGAVCAEVAGVAGCVDLAGSEEDDWRACVVLSVSCCCYTYRYSTIVSSVNMPKRKDSLYPQTKSKRTAALKS